MLLRTIKNKINFFFNKGHSRTIKLKKHIAYSFILKGVNIGIGLLLVPLLLNYLDQTKYGIWLTISSVVLWFNFFDVGLGHGLRNKLSEALAKNDYLLARKYVSTSYAGILILAIIFLLIFFLINPFLDWSLLLNTTAVPQDELTLLAIIVFGFFAFQIVFKMLYGIIYACQKPALRNLIETLGKLLILVIIVILIASTKDSLLLVGLSFSFAPVFVLILATLVMFSKSFRFLIPSREFVEFKLFKHLFSLGGKFFLIQFSAVVLYSSDNFIITQLFSPAEVTPYQIAFQYFAIILTVFGIVVTPFWSAITEAFVNQEFDWIRKSINKLIQVWFFALLLLIVMLVFSEKVYHLWIGDKVFIPFALSAVWALFIAIQTLTTIFVQFINGTGYIKLQMYLGLTGAVVNIPLSIFFAKSLGLGVVGVILATVATQILAIITVYMQYYKIINLKAYGIWNK